MPGFTHVATELAPYHVVGGLGVALAQLVAQLAEAGARSRVLTGAVERLPGPQTESWGHVVPLPVVGHGDERIASLTELALAALGGAGGAGGHDVLVAHDDECAAVLVHARRRGSPARRVYWLHSLYDRTTEQLPAALREGLVPGSLGASAIAAAELVVTSAGVLADAEAVAWPPPLHALQAALLHACERGATLTVEASQGLPPRPEPARLVAPDRPRVVLCGRPGVHKGTGIFLALAERLGHRDIDFVATGDPASARLDMARPGAARVRWLGWLGPAELVALLASASCVVFPSLCEGFGLGAAEAAQLGVPLIHHDIGGLRSLPRSPTTRALALDLHERAACYQTWAELQRCDRAQLWAGWDRAAPRFAALVDRWVAEVEHVLATPTSACERPGAPVQPPAPSWGRALLERVR